MKRKYSKPIVRSVEVDMSNIIAMSNNPSIDGNNNANPNLPVYSSPMGNPFANPFSSFFSNPFEKGNW